MASIFSSTALLSLPLPKPLSHLSCSQSPTPPTHQQPPTTTTTTTNSSSVSFSASKSQPRPKPAAESTDWIASSLTRRFGLGAGLAWVSFLAAGVVSEQIKTRFEASQQKANTRDVEEEEEVVLPNGIRYYEFRVGGGARPRTGDLVVIDLQGRVAGDGKTFINTFEGEGKRPLALVMGSRPYSKGMCEGVELVLRSMRAGGKRRVIVPPSLAFGEEGAELGSGVQIPPAATLEFVVQVDRVSVAPS